MAISKITSKKHGVRFQVDIKYKDQFGVTKRYIKSGFVDLKEAKKHEQHMKDELQAKLLEKNKVTLNDAFYEYMEVEGENKYAPATKIYYFQTYKVHIKDCIGNELLTSLKYVDLQKYFNNLSEKNNHPTLKNIKKTLAVTFKYAIRVGYIKENPIPYIQLPKYKVEERVKVETISDEDLNKILQALLKRSKYNPNPHAAEFNSYAQAISLIIGRYTGLRISETFALMKKDFDLDKHTMTVQRRLEYVGCVRKTMHLTERMKNSSSKATVEISKKLSGYLRKWFEINPYEMVICKADGSFMSPETLNVRLRMITKELGIHFHYHMLRHTYATELMMAGINPIIVKDLLRHSEVNTTWSIYTHPKNEDQRDILDNVYADMQQKVG